MTGRIIKIISNIYTVEAADNLYECHARGLFRKDKIKPLVGDLVTFNEHDLVITEIKIRKNELIRPNVSNIDACLIVTSAKEPEFSSFLLDKMLTNIIMNNITPIVIISKYDLLNNDEREIIDKYMAYYNSIGIKTFINTDIKKIKEEIKNLLVVLTGQTGVGKSTLANKMSSSLNLKTDEISYALGRGKHTTRHTEIFKIDDFFLMDTPGFSALDINIPRDNIRFAFREFPNEMCKYNNCLHLKEEGCYVKKLVNDGKILESRYENYQKIMEECGGK